jgi:NitT/TauT family transport system substrate-binding protein
MPMDRRKLLGALTAAMSLVAAGAVHAADAPKNVKFVVDWAYQGNHAFWSTSIADGTFKKLGLNVTMDRGYGSGDTIIKIAAGTYDIGFADINAMIKFNADHPDQRLIAVYQVFDRTPNAVITLKKTGITKPQDLNGKKLGAPAADSSRLMFPVFAKLNHVDLGSIQWQTVAPNLREAVLAKGQVDAITGFTTTSIFNLIATGIPRDDIVAMPFAKYGVNPYGSVVLVKPDFLKAHPDIVKAFVKGTIEGEISTIRNPAAAMETLKARDALFDVKLEQERLAMLLEDDVLTPDVKKNGLGYVDPVRMKQTIAANAEVYGFKTVPTVDDVYTAQFLPPQSERMAPAWKP